MDAVKVRCEQCGATASRIADVGNPWLDAGIVPYSTLDYRTDRDYWSQWFPPHFITESFPGQFRNWFYVLLTMSTVLEHEPPFQTVLGHAQVRDGEGREMHKSWGNAIEFNEAADRAGASVMRWMYMGTNPEHNVNFGWNTLAEVERRLLTLWNVYAFFVTYADLEGFDPAAPAPAVAERPALDRWVLSELHRLVQVATDGMDRFDVMTLVRRTEAFVEELSTWYVRRSRRRFWRATDKTDQAAAFATLHEVLVTLVKLIAPPMPFLAEEMYQNLVRSVDSAAPESVPVREPGRRSDGSLLSAGPESSASVRAWPVRQQRRDRALLDPGPRRAKCEADGTSPRATGWSAAKRSHPRLRAARSRAQTITVDGAAVELGPDSYEVEVEDQPGFSVIEEGGAMVALRHGQRSSPCACGSERPRRVLTDWVTIIRTSTCSIARRLAVGSSAERQGVALRRMVVRTRVRRLPRATTPRRPSAYQLANDHRTRWGRSAAVRRSPSTIKP